MKARYGKPVVPSRRRGQGPSPRKRMTVMVALLCVAASGLVVRAFDLQVVRKQFYQDQGDARFLREMPIAVSRGTIFDRNGEPLAVSTPVASIWANPPEVLENADRIPELAHALHVDADDLKQKIEARADKEFMYIARQMRPEDAQAIVDLKIPGISSQREYRRYYPSGAVNSHILGFTNIDDHGQEGLELAFDEWLAGKPGAKRVIRDRMGHVVEDVELVREPQPGRDLTLSIDRRIQYLAYSSLKDALEKNKADSGSIVVMDVHTGEVLGMANLPSFNPNAVRGSTPQERRNRAVTDVVEPGSTMKAFTMAAALTSGKYTPTSPLIETSPGSWMMGGHPVRDTHNWGTLTPTGVITKSSNVGAAKIAMTLDTDFLYDTYKSFGLGNSTGSGFPGEASGYLPVGRTWKPIEKSRLAYGYNLNVTPMQLAAGYAAIANGGAYRAPSFIKGADNPPNQIITPEVAHELVRMLETVLAPGGTGYGFASVANYSVAGKTGTSHKNSAGGYFANNYISLFVGMIPASNPRVVTVVVINDPKGGHYYGGSVAGPAFAQVMQGAVRLLDIPPDNVGRWYAGGPSQGGMISTNNAPPQADESAAEEVVP
ncbi:penicillin-binding protein 2 [Luteibacter aegosomatis]|uniref:peptidoglycan D,D-transpeptidase FtsI family protein n=1 Tax=Luteibacter aegosomatis TaxID=2911537 RepID=UPI001FF7FEFE|nr:penicillin-binding transpeptidase domain-containing protein [Luteibacter aegosomatis]UPG85128.1 penicillin-binding protein 2 [Luteibacter aegosomatis]